MHEETVQEGALQGEALQDEAVLEEVAEEPTAAEADEDTGQLQDGINRAANLAHDCQEDVLARMSDALRDGQLIDTGQADPENGNIYFSSNHESFWSNMVVQFLISGHVTFMFPI